MTTNSSISATEVFPEQEIFLGNNGTATRFLTSVAALGHGPFTINGDQRMHERPIKPLMEALSGWGVAIRSVHNTGCPPVAIAANGIKGGKTLLPEGMPIFIYLYTCMESTLTISQPKRSASSNDNSVLPIAVGPTNTSIFKISRCKKTLVDSHS